MNGLVTASADPRSRLKRGSGLSPSKRRAADRDPGVGAIEPERATGLFPSPAPPPKRRVAS